MIRLFFKEFRIWYLQFCILIHMYLLVFSLYHLPLEYFLTASLISVTLIILVSITHYLRFRRKLKILQEFSIEISDDGIGILPEDIPRLFEEGYTGFNGHEHQKASGLGLFMTKTILHQLQLDIKIESQVDQGTKVSIFKKER